MKIKVLLFGILAEKAGSAELEIENISTLKEMKKHIIEKFPSFASYKYRISLNQSLVDGNVSLADGDELALLPPFAGG
ncbi:MAG: MoaD/ThiS family protein [Bacteroidales bacterium]|nr:MoaD/ThiS family protein [Bacteroidales bacterium]